MAIVRGVSMSRIMVKINGMEYTVKGDEKEDHIYKIASYVDKKIRAIIEINPRLDTTAAAVLTAVNTVDELFKARQALEEAQKEKEKIKRLEENLNEEISALKNEIRNLEEINNESKYELKNFGSEEELKQKVKELVDKNEELLQKDEMISRLKNSLQRHLKEDEQLKISNKELKFQNQSGKYKILDLQQKLLDSQIDVARIKKQSLETKRPPQA